MARLLIAVAMMSLLGGCASTSTTVKAGGSEHGAGGSATIGTGIKF